MAFWALAVAGHATLESGPRAFWVDVAVRMVVGSEPRDVAG